MTEKRTLAFGVLFLVDLVISVVMLATDKNLQTDFGSVAPYYIHWWGVLAMAVVDLVVGLALVFSSVPAMEQKMSARLRRAGTAAAILWAVIAIGIMVGVVSEWSQLGFSSMMQFEQYLFGPTPFGHGVLSYIPWLYDLLLAAYLVTLAVGIVAFLKKSGAPTGTSST